mmetsp:Transcript_8935/g.24160  ORF Transcript_8935/g.24160 Transcript_8935/m.24160 type:complete len:106 (-) Transcript_8935:864-1181(-)
MPACHPSACCGAATARRSCERLPLPFCARMSISWRVCCQVLPTKRRHADVPVHVNEHGHGHENNQYVTLLISVLVSHHSSKYYGHPQMCNPVTPLILVLVQEQAA